MDFYLIFFIYIFAACVLIFVIHSPSLIVMFFILILDPAFWFMSWDLIAPWLSIHDFDMIQYET